MHESKCCFGSWKLHLRLVTYIFCTGTNAICVSSNIPQLTENWVCLCWTVEMNLQMSFAFVYIISSFP